MIQLINRDDIKLYRQISDTVYDDVLNEHINDAQFSDLQPLMGMNFYNDLMRNYTDANYTSLLDGSIYTYKDITYTNVGLKAVLVHYAYGRYVMFGGQVDTPFGFVEKTNQDSQIVSATSKATKGKMNQQVAYNYWENVKLFLERNSSDYPLYESCYKQNNRGIRFSKIGGGDDNYNSRSPYIKRYV